MDPARLRLLRELGDRGSVAAVATAMRISASAVSQQLAALQAGVGVALTVKEGRRLVLTEAGEALAVAGTRVEEALAHARGAVDSYLGLDHQPVRVSAFHSAALTFFGPLLAELGGSARVRFTDADVAHDRFSGLTADHDLVIAHRLSHDPEWPTARLRVTPLLAEPLDIALHVDHPLAAHSAVRPDQLRDERWISTHEGFPLAGVLAHLGAQGGFPPRIEHRINEFSVAAAIVRTGAAIAVMPRTTAASLAVDGMTLRPVEGVSLIRHVDVLARPDALARTAVTTVLTALATVAAGSPQPADPRGPVCRRTIVATDGPSAVPLEEEASARRRSCAEV